MAKNKNRRRSRRSMTVPIAVVAGMAPLAASAVRGWQNETFRGAGKEVLFALTGVDIDNSPHFNPSFMINGTIPLIMGVVAHKVASKVGVNRLLGQMGIPFIRI